MGKYILFSEPTENSVKKLSKELFGDGKGKTVAYMPSDGANSTPDNQFSDFWRKFTSDNDADFIYLDNSLREEGAEAEIGKMMKVDILLMSGGNTFILLDHLRKSGFDDAIKKFAKQPGKIIAGFSAGAIVLTPSIDTAEGLLPDPDENVVGLEDLTALGLVDFEVYPHYEKDKHLARIEEYKKKTDHEVKTLAADDVLII